LQSTSDFSTSFTNTLNLFCFSAKKLTKLTSFVNCLETGQTKGSRTTSASCSGSVCLGEACTSSSPSYIIQNSGNLYANRISQNSVPVTSDYEVISAIDYSSIDLDTEMDNTLKSILANPEIDVKGPLILIMKLGDRETGSNIYTQWNTADQPYA